MPAPSGPDQFPRLRTMGRAAERRAKGNLPLPNRVFSDGGQLAAVVVPLTLPGGSEPPALHRTVPRR
jgi:hypothetical protein